MVHHLKCVKFIWIGHFIWFEFEVKPSFLTKYWAQNYGPQYLQFEFQGIFAKYHLLEALYFGSVPKISARLSVFWNVLIPVKGVTHLSVTANIGVQGRIS